MGRGIITASRTACLRAEQEVASRGEKCARTFSIGSQIAKNRFRDPSHLLPVGIPRSVRQNRGGRAMVSERTARGNCVAQPLGDLDIEVCRTCTYGVQVVVGILHPYSD